MKANFQVTSVAGHIYNRDFPKEFQDRKLDPAALFLAPTARMIDGSSYKIVSHLQRVT